MVIELETVREAKTCLSSVERLFTTMAVQAKCDDEPEELHRCNYYSRKVMLLIKEIEEDYPLEDE